MSRVTLDDPNTLYQTNQEQEWEYREEQQQEEEQEQKIKPAEQEEPTLYMRDEKKADLVDYYGNKYTQDDLSLKHTSRVINYYLANKYGKETLRERIKPATGEFSEVHHKRSRSIVKEGNGDEIVEFMLAGSGFTEFRKEHKGFHGKGKSYEPAGYTYEEVEAAKLEAQLRYDLEKSFNPKKWGKWARFKSFFSCIFNGFNFDKHNEKNRIRKIYEEAKKQRTEEELNKEIGESVTINNKSHKHVRYKSKVLSNGTHLHRYNIAGATTPKGMFNRGSHSIDNNLIYIKALGEERLADWIANYNQGTIKPLRFLFRGHSRGGVAAATGAMMIKQSALELTKDNAELQQALLSNLKFEIIQHDPVPGIGSDSGVFAEADYHIQTKAMKEKNLPALGDNLVESTVFYSLHTDHDMGFTPQKILGAKRVILTPQYHSSGLNRIQKGDFVRGNGFEETETGSQVFTDAKTRIKYRGAGISELPEGLYIQDERGELVKMESPQEAIQIYRTLLGINMADMDQLDRHMIVEDVIREFFSCSVSERKIIGNLLEKKNDDSFEGFEENEQKVLADGVYEQQRAIIDSAVKDLLALNLSPNLFKNKETAVQEYHGNRNLWLKAAKVYSMYENKDQRVYQYIERLPEAALEKFKQAQVYVDNMLKLVANMDAPIDTKMKPLATIELDELREESKKSLSMKKLFADIVKNEKLTGYDKILSSIGNKKKWNSDYITELFKLLSQSNIESKDNPMEVGFEGREELDALLEEYKKTAGYTLNPEVDLKQLAGKDSYTELMRYINWKMSITEEPEEKKRLSKAYNYSKIYLGLIYRNFSIEDITGHAHDKHKEALARGGAESLQTLLAAKDYFKTPEEMQEFLVNLSGIPDYSGEYQISSGKVTVLRENMTDQEVESLDVSEEELQEEQKSQLASQEKELLHRKKEAVKELIYVSKLSYNELEKMVGIEEPTVEYMITHAKQLVGLDYLGQVWSNYFMSPDFIDQSNPEDLRFYHQVMYIHNLASVAMNIASTSCIGTEGEDVVFDEDEKKEEFKDFIEEMNTSRRYLTQNKMLEPVKYVKIPYQSNGGELD